jgi:hypothetical protein
MNSKRILIPLALRRSTTDALLYLQQAAPESPYCATLLYVVELNIVTSNNRLYQEICAESEAALRNLSMVFLVTKTPHGSASVSAAPTRKYWPKPAPASPNSSSWPVPSRGAGLTLSVPTLSNASCSLRHAPPWFFLYPGPCLPENVSPGLASKRICCAMLV